MLTDITTIDKGVIMHQVNCQDIMGAGVAKALYTKYPQVKEKFHQLATQPDYNTPDKRVGLVQPVRISDQLVVLNSFSQLYYGRKKGVVYTDHQSLLTNLSKLDAYAKKHNLPAYVPARIGCGLAGGDWSIVEQHIKQHTDITIVYPD